MKKYLMYTTIGLLLVLILTSSIIAYPAEPSGNDQADQPVTSDVCRNQSAASLAEIPSHRADYLHWTSASNCIQLSEVRMLTVPVTGSTRPGSYQAFKELQADLFSGQ